MPNQQFNQPLLSSGKAKFNLRFILIILILTTVAGLGILAYIKYTDKEISFLPSLFNFKKHDETTSWQTYRNEEYGFEFKYPKDWIVSFNKEGEDSNKQSIAIDITEGNLDDIISNIKEFAGFPAFPEMITIDGHKAYNLIAGDAGGVAKAVYIYIDNKTTLEISGTFFVGEDDSLYNQFNQILSTFKFIK